jgi:hypothetical protein
MNSRKQDAQRCGTVFENRAAVLMARIVDRSGVALRRSQVAAVEYSIFKREVEEGRKRVPVAVPLRVADVFFDSLMTGGLWTLDIAGYNFRHEIPAGGQNGFRNAGTAYTILYLFTTPLGEKTAVRFDLRINHR